MTPFDMPRPGLPRHGLLREITDQAVIDTVLARGQVTRSELAELTGISKPTISESARRLEGAGLLQATGVRSGFRGRVATYYELATQAGWVLAMDIDSEGVHTRCADLSGVVFDEHHHPPGPQGDTGAVVRSIRAATRRSIKKGDRTHGRLRALAMSVSNAVDPATSRILVLPSASFPEGKLDPSTVLADLVTAPILVDNDINCAALAEHRAGAAVGEDSFAYLFVGSGFGMGLYSNGRMIRGAHGLAGEVSYLATATGPAEYSTLVSALGQQGFGTPDSNALDVPTIRRSLAGGRTEDKEAARAAAKAARTLGTAIGQIIIATCAVVDPDLVLVGGPLGRHPALFERARRTVADLFPSPVRIELGAIGETASLQGALHLALDHSRRNLLKSASA
ncbi:MAG: ROK family transcriptional regulator [Actinomycetes bacterium]